MSLSNEKTAEIQTIAKLVGANPTADQVVKTYDTYLLALNDPPAYEAQKEAEAAAGLKVWKILGGETDN